MNTNTVVGRGIRSRQVRPASLTLLALWITFMPITGTAMPMKDFTGNTIPPIDRFWTAPATVITLASGWTFQGVGPRDGALRLAPSTTRLTCVPTDIDGGGAAFDAAVGLCAGHDPYAPGAYDDGNYYNGARFQYGTLRSPQRTAAPFDQAIVSWAAATPPGTWLQAHLRVRLASGAWTHWYKMPIWASDAGTIRRHSIDGQQGVGTVTTDTLVLRHGALATAYQVAVTLFIAGGRGEAGPALRRLSLATSRGTPAAPLAAPARSAAWGHDLTVPPRSQMLAAYKSSPYGGGGENWCSPTSTSMILAYWAHVLHRPDLVESVPEAAHATYDWTYQGTGNWPFNVAHAASFTGMDGYVARFTTLSALAPWIAAGVPLALSVAFAPGALPGAPIPSTNGHLLVLRGFDRAGNPIVNDPAAPDNATVRRVYARAALERAWLAGSNGTVYVIFPQGWNVP